MGAVTAVVSGVVAAGAAIAGAAISADASRDAARTQAEAYERGTALQVQTLRDQWAATQRLMAPLINVQYGANSQFAHMLGLQPGGFAAPPADAGGGAPPPNPTLGQPLEPAWNEWRGSLARRNEIIEQRRREQEAARRAAAGGGSPAVGQTASGLQAGDGGAPPGSGGGGLVQPEPGQVTGGYMGRRQDVPDAYGQNVAAQRQFTSGPPGQVTGGFQGGDNAFAQAGLPPPNRGYGMTPMGFFDPNLNPTFFGRSDWRESDYGQQVRDRRLAGDDPNQDWAMQRANETRLFDGVDQDSLFQWVQGNQARDAIDQERLATQLLQQDQRFAWAGDTAVVGSEFETSPGYEFAMEEALRASDRALSRGGGNYGGRAAIEAQRRAAGVASQDYYNWVGARQQDLARQDAAAAAWQSMRFQDAGRMDQAAYFDLTRGDRAVADARRREELDLARGDTAFASWLERYGAQVAREDSAVLDNIMRQQQDIARQDQSYYNYMNYLAALSGAGGNPAQAVAGMGQQTASQIGGAQAGGAFGVGNAWAQNAANQGAIWGGAVSNVGNAINQSIQNAWWMDNYGGGAGA